MSDSIRNHCAGTHRPDTSGVYCADCGWVLVSAFYSDPVDEHGNVTGTVNLKITSSTFGDPVAVKVPHDELIMDDAMTIHVREEDFPNG